MPSGINSIKSANIKPCLQSYCVMYCLRPALIFNLQDGRALCCPFISISPTLCRRWRIATLAASSANIIQARPCGRAVACSFVFIFPPPLYQRRAREKFATQKRSKWVNWAENSLIWLKIDMRLVHGLRSNFRIIL